MPGSTSRPRTSTTCLRAGRQNVLLDRRDLAVADRDIHHAVDFGRGTDDVSTAQQQVIGLVVGHGRSPSSAAVDGLAASICEDGQRFSSMAVCQRLPESSVAASLSCIAATEKSFRVRTIVVAGRGPTSPGAEYLRTTALMRAQTADRATAPASSTPAGSSRRRRA